jgi:hypothetical protein
MAKIFNSIGAKAEARVCAQVALDMFERLNSTAAVEVREKLLQWKMG